VEGDGRHPTVSIWKARGEMGVVVTLQENDSEEDWYVLETVSLSTECMLEVEGVGLQPIDHVSGLHTQRLRQLKAARPPEHLQVPRRNTTVHLGVVLSRCPAKGEVLSWPSSLGV
jgi:hypothetical protein